MATAFNWYNWTAGLVDNDFGETKATDANYFYWSAGLVATDKCYVSNASVVGSYPGTITVAGKSFKPFSDSADATVDIGGTAQPGLTVSDAEITGAVAAGTPQGTQIITVTTENGSDTATVLIPYTDKTVTITFRNLGSADQLTETTTQSIADTARASYDNRAESLQIANLTSGTHVSADSTGKLVDGDVYEDIFLLGMCEQ